MSRAGVEPAHADVKRLPGAASRRSLGTGPWRVLNLEPHGQSDGRRQRNRHGVAHLLVLPAHAVARELERVGESLEACSFADRDRPALCGVDIRSPMRVALGENGRGEAPTREPAIAFGVVLFFRTLHSRGEQVVRDVPPVAALADVLDTREHCGRDLVANMVAQAYGPLAQE